MGDNAGWETELHGAYVAGDLDKVKSLARDPEAFPNGQDVGALYGPKIPLEYAIYHSPIGFIAALLELGADPNYENHAGFPALIAALSTERPDLIEILEMLLAAGADVHQRGVNGFTPLHYAARYKDPRQVQFLIDQGADPNARTDVDDFTTPLEEAVDGARPENAALLDPVTGEQDEG